MRFYRNTYHTEGGNNDGYGWFGTEAEARKDARQHDREIKDFAKREGGDTEFNTVGPMWPEDKTDPVAEPIDILVMKEGILAALRRYASHADNG